MTGISEFVDGIHRYGDVPGERLRVASAIREALEREPNRLIQLSPGAARQIALWLSERVSVKWRQYGGEVERICRVEELAPVIEDMLRVPDGVEAGSVRVMACGGGV